MYGLKRYKMDLTNRNKLNITAEANRAKNYQTLTEFFYTSLNESIKSEFLGCY